MPAVGRGTAAATGLLLLLIGWLGDPGGWTALLAVVGALALGASFVPRLASVQVLVALAYLGQLAVGSVSLAVAAVGALVLAVHIAASETARSWLPGIQPLRTHLPPQALAVTGVVVTALVADVSIGGVSGVAAIAVAAAVSAALLAAAVSRDDAPH